MAAERDIVEEQSFLDRAYDALEWMRVEARKMLDEVIDTGRGGTFQSRTERDIVVRTSLARLEHLEVGDQPLTFGRIDVAGEDPSAPEVFHIGRLAVSDDRREPMIVDWRAPVAEPFYRATGLDPQGLVRRRHLSISHRNVVGVEDEYFATPEAPGVVPGAVGEGLVGGGMGLGGPGALLSALGQARTGQMSDIVGTIQREQDEIIRAPLSGVLLVQGGPGTGKTAVALHRAAYLLYTHRFPLERQGLLVVGPNPLFLRYIEQVLPSLGETGVTLSTISGLVSEARVRGTESEPVERLKGDPRMAQVVARAVRTRQRPLKEDVLIPFGASTLRFRASTSADIVGRARRRPGTHNARRRFVEAEVMGALASQYRSRRGSELSDEEFDLADFSRQIRQMPEIREALRRMWPRLSAHELLHDLFGAAPLIRVASEGILSEDEYVLLQRDRSVSLDAVAWTVADIALIDEIRPLLGSRAVSRPKRRVEKPSNDAGWPQGLDGSDPVGPDPEKDEIRAFGHIVVDEAQDLSPMQLRMLARRSLSNSMTLVGDIAQATGCWAPSSWDEITEHLGVTKAPHRVDLTVSYRTPSEVIEVSRHVLDAAGTGLVAPRPVRQVGERPCLELVSPDALVARVVAATRDEVERVSPGHVAVLAPRSMLSLLAAGFEGSGVNPVDPAAPGGPGLAAPLVLMATDQAHGLEFDGVVIVEPAEVAARGAEGTAGEHKPTYRGLRTLYVAMTRPTRRLRMVGSRAFPVDLPEGALEIPDEERTDTGTG
ncbi:MAG: UvrD-helicase domain-containing protein [Actinomycetes bacterium]